MSDQYLPTYIDNIDNSISIMNNENAINFYKVNGNINTLLAKNITNRLTTDNLNLSSFDGTNLNPVITINNSNSNCEINTILKISNHILPTSNALYDIGSAEYKIRHLFLSNNSLWIGDQHKIDVSDGTIKFRKRKIGIPKTILNAGGNADAAKSNSGKGDISELTLQDWHNYAKTLNHATIGGGVGKAKIEEIFKPTESGDWDENDTTMDKLVIKKNIDVSGNLNVNANSCINLPIGTSTTRPTNPSLGTIRYNSETYCFEGYCGHDGGKWVNLSSLPQ